MFEGGAALLDNNQIEDGVIELTKAINSFREVLEYIELEKWSSNLMENLNVYCTGNISDQALIFPEIMKGIQKKTTVDIVVEGISDCLKLILYTQIQKN